ncbi:hypothetical protein [Croceibacterium aestuarii]|uniref:hypothetical protein n=1 Tax=Croceibacterium aestuarii TaxID=3064139 RepID=UPI00272E626E|nr:hypothetical protein [Croceibacterium sp. D39]
MKKLLATTAAFGLIVAPVMAQAADAREGSPASKSEQLQGSNMILIGAIVAAAIVAGILIFDDNNDSPTSP